MEAEAASADTTPPPAAAAGGGATFITMRGLLTAVVLPLLLVAFHFASPPPSKSTYHSLFVSLADNATAARHLLALTRRPHVAGSPANAAAASYVLGVLSSAGFASHSVSYDVLLSYPIRRSLTLAASADAPAAAFELAQEACPDDPDAAAAVEVTPTFHAYAHSGTAAGPVVYANYGRVEDFAALEAMGVNVTGAVVLARYGKIYRGDIVKNAEDAGAAGAVVYTDAADYGGGGPGRWFPHGPGMPPSGVQVGSVFRGLGDPTTPGWPSSGGAYEVSERLSSAEMAATRMTPGVPSLPVSARDGEAIQKTIGGEVAPDDWQAGEGAPTYYLGPGPGFLNLSYDGNETLASIENVFAVIEGEQEPDRYILLGNHRDAWTFGAVDPNSGTASLLELAQRMRKLQRKGWKPRRTIVFCNWDAEEYGLVGSTEWAEENLDILASRAIAYLNVDCGVQGSGFYASSTPQLDELLKQASKQVPDPDNSSQTIYDLWTSSHGHPLIDRLGGGGSDYATFVQHVGIPSTDMSFGKGYPVYHSLYDDFLWMQKFGDPMFHKHAAVASIWGLVALKLADEEILPFDYVSYATELKESAKILESEVLGMPVNFAPLYNSIDKLREAASKVNNRRKELESKTWTQGWRKDSLRIRELNDRLMMAERAFTDRDGLPGREFFKHLIYGPSKHDDYGSKSFPGIGDAIESAKSLNTSESWHYVQHELWRAARAVTRASFVLVGKLT